jgi:PIN domain nuclease of toxin-antitoxin system
VTLLLDTHACIWWRTGDARLREPARRVIAQAERVFVSAASAWEVAIKISNGKLKLPEPFARGVDNAGFRRLNVSFEHAQGVSVLPWHHRDQFDRILIAQALAEDLTIVTADEIFSAYGTPVIPA